MASDQSTESVKYNKFSVDEEDEEGVLSISAHELLKRRRFNPQFFVDPLS